MAMVYGQLAHAFGLNDICDALAYYENPLKTIRGATPPSRNGLSNANIKRNGKMAEELFWEVFKLLRSQFKGFGKNYKAVNGILRRLRRCINIVDSTTISLVDNCMSWAKHRRRKAAVKCHMRLDFHSFLPKFAVVDTAKHSNPAKAY